MNALLRLVDGPPRRTALALFGLLLLAYLAAGDYRYQSVDPGTSLLAAWRLGTQGTLRLDDFAGQNLWLVRTPDGWVSGRFPGPMLLAAPLYALMPTAVPSAVPAVVAASLCASGAMTLLYLAMRRLAPARAAVGAALLAGLGTSTWAVSSGTLWTHAPAQLGIAGAVLAAASRRYLTCGLLLGVAILSRPHLAVLAAVIGLGLSLAERRARPAVLVALGSGAGLLALLLYNRAVFHEWSVQGGYASVDPTMGEGTGASVLLRNAVGTALSPGRGLLVLMPCVALLLPGLPAAWRTAPGWTRAAAASGASYLLLQLWLSPYHGGSGFFGNRVVLEGLTAMAPLLLLSGLHWTSRAAWRAPALAVLSAASVATAGAGAFFYDGREPEPRVVQEPGLLVLVREDGLPVLLLASALSLACLAAARALRGSPNADAVPRVEEPA